MAVISLTLEDIYKSILTPIYHDIARDISSDIKLPKETKVILYSGNETNTTDSKTNTSGITSDNLPTATSLKRLEVKVEEDYSEDTLTNTTVNQVNGHPIFLDTDIGFSIYPIRVKSDIEISFTYVTPSRSEINRIRDDIRLRLSQTRNIRLHDLEYDIHIPRVVEDFISDIYDLKSRLFPMELDEYFLSHVRTAVRPITDMSNTSNSILAIKEKQVRVMGVYDFNSMPEKVEVDNDMFKLTFSYKVSVDIPRAMAVRYPIMVCNRLIPQKYIEYIISLRTALDEEYKRNLSYDLSMHGLSELEAHRELERKMDIKLPVNIPYFDEFGTRTGVNGYGIVVSILTDVNENNLKGLFNLHELDDYMMHSALLKFISETERNFITVAGQSFFYMGLHQEEAFFDASVLEIDAELSVSCKRELSLVKPVRVTFSICFDPKVMDPKAITRLSTNYDMVILAICEYMRMYRDFKLEMNRSGIDIAVIVDFITRLLTRAVYEENLDIIAKVLNIVKDSDSYLFNELVRITFYFHNDLFLLGLATGIIDESILTKLKLISHGNGLAPSSVANLRHRRSLAIRGLEDSGKLPKRDFNVLDRFAAKTVMTTYMVSRRTNDL